MPTDTLCMVEIIKDCARYDTDAVFGNVALTVQVRIQKVFELSEHYPSFALLLVVEFGQHERVCCDWRGHVYFCFFSLSSAPPDHFDS